MRLLRPCAIALGLAICLAGAPAPAQDAGASPDPGVVKPEPFDPSLARLNRSECRRLGRQIVHFTDVAAQASERDDELWEKSTVAHVDRLEARWNALCATEDDSFARMVNAALKTAARLAIRYFTMGYLP